MAPITLDMTTKKKGGSRPPVEVVVTVDGKEHCRSKQTDAFLIVCRNSKRRGFDVGLGGHAIDIASILGHMPDICSDIAMRTAAGKSPPKKHDAGKAKPKK